MSDRKHHATYLAIFGGLGLVAGLLLSGCSTLKACAQPVTAQAIQDGSAVLACAADGSKTLAACEESQLAVEAGQLTADLLVCGEEAVANAAKGAHTAAK